MKFAMMYRLLAVGLLLFAGLLVSVAGARAEDGESAAPGIQNRLDEILVTARKREENLQDVSQSVTAISQRESERRFDLDLQDYADAAPNIIIDDLQQGPGSPAAISIRGIGVADVEKSFEPTTGVVLDGIFIGANSGAMLKSLDIERIEILRGPQGTLFGRNAIAGVINITRTKPTQEFGGKLRLGYGNHDASVVEAVVNVGLGDIGAVKVSGASRKRDGWFDNLFTGEENGKMDFRSYSVNLLLTPVEDIEIEYTFEETDQNQDANTVLNLAQPGQLFCDVFAQCAPSLTVPQSGDRYAVLQNGDVDGPFFDTKLHIVELRWQISEDYSFDYIFGSFETDERVTQDWDGTSLTLFHTNRPATYEQRSHEFRITRSSTSALNFVIGAYIWDSNYQIDLVSFIGFVVPGVVLEIPQTARQTTDSLAGFFEIDYDITDKLTITVGGRYTDEKKTGGIRDFILDNLANPERESWDQFTPKGSIKYAFTDDLMAYFLYSRGFRSGGFNGRPTGVEPSTIPYDPETVDNFELGFKSEWLDNRLRVNGAIFFMKYDDKQEEINEPVSVGTGQQTVVRNVSAVEIKGLELEFIAFLSEGLTLQGNLGLLDADYTKFDADINGDLVADETDEEILLGLKLRRAPKVNFTLSGTYEWELGNSVLAWVRADWHMIGAHEVTFFNSPQTRNSAQHLINASINFQYEETTFSIYGKNLAKEDGYTVGFDVANLWTYAAPRPPRTYGVQILQKF